MKNFFNYCVVFLTPFAFFYLCISFAKWDFNSANWAENIRLALLLFGGIGSLISTIIYYENTKQKNENN